jgi:large subunit ribosomal protein L3
MKGIIGKKVGMTQLFDEKGAVVPVTVIEAGPCYVTQVKTIETDGYNAIQLGFEEVAERKLTKGQKGHLQKAGTPTVRRLREMRSDDATQFDVTQYSLGDVVKADIFQDGELVDVIGISKGKGFAGGVKRHGFGGGPKTHGQSDRHRATGSRGAGTTPGHTWLGSRAPGQMGNDQVTVQNMKIALVDAERNLIAVRGAVPGPRGGLVLVRASKKGRKA